MDREIVGLAIGEPKEMPVGRKKSMMTGIIKQPVEKAMLTQYGFVNDRSHDLRHHGGPDRTVCIYPAEHYTRWNEQFQIALPHAAFGENLTVTNMLEKDVCIGDVFRIGRAIIQVTEARNPCATIGKRNDLSELFKEVRNTGFTGYLCRTIEVGEICLGDKLECIERPDDLVTVAFCHENILHGHGTEEELIRILEVEALSERYRFDVETRLINLVT
ncbi:MOSC domain-containing protein [Listeria grandensis]|uniref:MOSC domain-containing protein n=1 Tax=Listeria grandensis TaxID=1494963 RepID=A0A7X1CP20_9LIST|nr:MOSC domain-containing protein [Listeria grandensis]MBC1473518.1 MOSC domain-containing protein [Listeria grandensis]MBC1935544.1 MOSC domain-containing protein [Listeria grandensis]